MDTVEIKKWASNLVRRVVIISLLLITIVFSIGLTACSIGKSSDDQVPVEGTSGWYWEKAKESFSAWGEAERASFSADSDEERRVQLEAQKTNLEEAIKYLDEAIKLNPNDPEYFRMRGQAHYTLGENELALEDYNKAILLAPNYNDLNYRILGESLEGVLYFNRSLVYEELGMNDLAIADLKKCISLTKNKTQIEIYEGRINSLTK